MKTADTYQRLVLYVNAASDLAESVATDIKAGREYSNVTVLKLSRFVAAAHYMDKMIKHINANNAKLN